MAVPNRESIRNHAAFIWSVADLLRGDYKQSEYSRVILPFVVLRRLDCVLEPTKEAAVQRASALAGRVANVDPLLRQVTGEQFYNTSPLTMHRVLDDPSNVADNLLAYTRAFSSGAREYKSTLRTGAESGEVIKALETACLKTIAAFANSRDGGTLLIGVADDGSVHGLASDYASLHQPGKDDRDRFQLHLGQLLINAVGETVASSVSVQVHTLDGADLCRVHVPPSRFPVEATVAVDK
ncbi:MAG: type I restriction-modification system subunit M N-terminal domain-containing protein, partial [Geodermatophilaceae bacterium]